MTLKRKVTANRFKDYKRKAGIRNRIRIKYVIHAINGNEQDTQSG